MHALTVSSRSHAILFQFYSFIMSLEWNPSLDHLVVTSIFFSSSMVFLLLVCVSVVIHFFNGLALQWQCSCSCTLQCAQYRSFFFLHLSPKTMIINNNNNNNERTRERERDTHTNKKHRHSTVHNELHLFTDDSLTVSRSVCSLLVRLWLRLPQCLRLRSCWRLSFVCLLTLS